MKQGGGRGLTRSRSSGAPTGKMKEKEYFILLSHKSTCFYRGKRKEGGNIISSSLFGRKLGKNSFCPLCPLFSLLL